MADNGTAASGPTIAWDDIGSVAYQRLKLALGADGVYTADADGSAARGMFVDPRAKVALLQVTPVISASAAYAAGDCLGGLMTFAGAARAAGGSGTVRQVVVLDKTQAQRAPIDLVFFDRSVSVAGDNSPFACSDADMAFCLGVLSIGAYNTAWPGTPLNSVSTLLKAGFEFVVNGTDLFCQAVVQGTPTYTSTSDLVFSLNVAQN